MLRDDNTGGGGRRAGRNVAKLNELRQRMPDAGGLVIAPSIQMAEYITTLIELIEGERPMLVHSQNAVGKRIGPGVWLVDGAGIVIRKPHGLRAIGSNWSARQEQRIRARYCRRHNPCIRLSGDGPDHRQSRAWQATRRRCVGR